MPIMTQRSMPFWKSTSICGATVTDCADPSTLVSVANFSTLKSAASYDDRSKRQTLPSRSPPYTCSITWLW